MHALHRERERGQRQLCRVRPESLREFRRRTKDNQLYHSHEFNKPPLQQSLVCNEVYDNNDFFKKSLQDDRDLRKGWVLTQSQENLLQKKPRLDSSINFRSMRPKNNLTQSREFLEEKQIVNDVIDDLIKKNQKSYKDLRAPVREPMKEYMKESMKESLKEPIKESIKETRTLMCSNEDGKKVTPFSLRPSTEWRILTKSCTTAPNAPSCFFRKDSK